MLASFSLSCKVQAQRDDLEQAVVQLNMPAIATSLSAISAATSTAKPASARLKLCHCLRVLPYNRLTTWLSAG